MDDNWDRKRIVSECWNESVDCIGSSYIYSKRIKKTEPWLRWSKVLGFLIPVLVGAMALSYGDHPEFLQWAIYITTPIAIAQLLLSGYQTVTGIEEKNATHLKMSIEFSLLHREFDNLAKLPDGDTVELKSKYKILMARSSNLGQSTSDLTDEECRMGLRYGLRNYNRACVKCEEIPYSMNPTECPVCGQFNKNMI